MQPPSFLPRLATAAKTRRSPLYVWMLENHDAFAAIVAEAVRPNWKELAKAFEEQRIYDADNKPASDEVTRQTWWRVRKTVEARQAKRIAKASRPKVAVPIEARVNTPAVHTQGDDQTVLDALKTKARPLPKPI